MLVAGQIRTSTWGKAEKLLAVLSNLTLIDTANGNANMTNTRDITTVVLFKVQKKPKDMQNKCKRPSVAGFYCLLSHTD